MRHLDPPLLAVTLALCIVGWLVLDSVTVHHLGMGPEALRQLLAMGLGLLLLIGFSYVPPRFWGTCSPLAYAMGLLGLLLVRVPGIGYVSHGARRWIMLGPLGAVQPSELAKLALVMLVAWLLSRPTESGEVSASPPAPARGRGLSARLTLGALALTVLPCALILAQPDMGTALVLLGSAVVLLVVSGASPVLLLGLATLACIAAPHFMQGYQHDRLMTFLDPGADPMGLGYNLLQARTAVGAGRLLGSGLFAGIMTQHGFVPENRTDFIFSAVGEELGFVGCMGMLCLYGVLIGRPLVIAWRARDRFELLLSVGVATILFLHVFINAGMVLGLLPATGLPLPFVSYGGTAIVTQMAALGMVAGIVRRRLEAREDVWGLQQPLSEHPSPARWGWRAARVSIPMRPSISRRPQYGGGGH